MTHILSFVFRKPFLAFFTALTLLFVGAMLISSFTGDGEAVASGLGLGDCLNDFRPYLDLFSGWSFDVHAFSSGTLSSGLTLPAILLLLFGTLMCLFGYPLQKVVLLTVAFLASTYAGIYFFDFTAVGAFFAALLPVKAVYYVLSLLLGLSVLCLATRYYRGTMAFAIHFVVNSISKAIVRDIFKNGEGISFFETHPLLAFGATYIFSWVVSLFITFAAEKVVRTALIFATALAGAATCAFALAGVLPDFGGRTLILTALFFLMGASAQLGIQAKK